MSTQSITQNLCKCITFIYRVIRFICCCCGCCCTAFWLLILWALISISISLNDIDFDATENTCYHKLGLTPNATQRDIQKAFRKLALKYHPDKVEIDKKKESEKIFQEISHCYEILNNDETRKQYDSAGFRETNSFGIPFDDDINLKDIFQFFYQNFDFDFDIDPDHTTNHKTNHQTNHYKTSDKTRKLKKHTINLKLDDIINDKQKIIKIGKNQYIIDIPGGIPNGYIIKDELNGYNWKIKVDSMDKTKKWKRRDDKSVDIYQNIKISMQDISMNKDIEITMIDGTTQKFNLNDIDYTETLVLEQNGLKKFKTRRKYKNKGNALIHFDILKNKKDL